MALISATTTSQEKDMLGEQDALAVQKKTNLAQASIRGRAKIAGSAGSPTTLDDNGGSYAQEGSKTYPDGTVYHGLLRHGQRTGRGTLFSPDGSMLYCGEWLNDQMHGMGTHYYNDGSKYIGQWFEGKRHGEGTFYYAAVNPVGPKPSLEKVLSLSQKVSEHKDEIAAAAAASPVINVEPAIKGLDNLLPPVPEKEKEREKDKEKEKERKEKKRSKERKRSSPKKSSSDDSPLATPTTEEGGSGKTRGVPSPAKLEEGSRSLSPKNPPSDGNFVTALSSQTDIAEEAGSDEGRKLAKSVSFSPEDEVLEENEEEALKASRPPACIPAGGCLPFSFFFRRRKGKKEGAEDDEDDRLPPESEDELEGKEAGTRGAKHEEDEPSTPNDATSAEEALTKEEKAARRKAGGKGKKSGEGVQEYEDGGRYCGELKSGKRHGHGILYGPDGSVVYDGEWKDDKKHGDGLFVYPDGSKFAGAWRKDRRHGDGTYFFANGGRYEGAWYKDREEGKGTCHLPDGTKYCGAWHEGEMHGKGTLYSKEGGVLYSGRWKNGEPVNVSQ